MHNQGHAAIQSLHLKTCNSWPDPVNLVRHHTPISTILRMKELAKRLKLSRATVYLLIAEDPTCPRKIKLSTRAVGYLESDVEAWIASRATT